MDEIFKPGMRSVVGVELSQILGSDYYNKHGELIRHQVAGFLNKFDRMLDPTEYTVFICYSEHTPNFPLVKIHVNVKLPIEC